MKNDHFLPPFGFFLLINYLFTHELSLLPHSCFASLKASGERPCWKPFGNYSRQHSQPFLIQLLLTFSKNGRSEKVMFIYKSYNNYSLAKGIALLFQPRKFPWWNDNAGNYHWGNGRFSTWLSVQNSFPEQITHTKKSARFQRRFGNHNWSSSACFPLL